MRSLAADARDSVLLAIIAASAHVQQPICPGARRAARNAANRQIMLRAVNTNPYISMSLGFDRGLVQVKMPYSLEERIGSDESCNLCCSLSRFALRVG
mgnify:CR=1 FL=1